MLDILESSAGCGQAPRGQAQCGIAPPTPPHPSVSLEQLLAKQNELMRMLLENDMHRGVGHPQQLTTGCGFDLLEFPGDSPSTIL
jgi:hypothetical protein